jgi:hypothetical protein
MIVRPYALVRVVFALCALISASAFAQPTAPTNLKALQGDQQVTLSWDSPAGAVTFNVYYSTTSPVTKATAKETQGIQLASQPVTGLKNGEQFFFAVSAENAAHQESPLSDSVAATPAAAGAGDGVGQDQSKTVAASGAANSTPTTNVGSTSSSNVQNPTITYTDLPSKLPASLNTASGTITYVPKDVESIISTSCGAQSALLSDSSTFALINVINVGGTTTQSVKSNNWYIYSKKKGWYDGFGRGWQLVNFDGATRFYGVSQVLFISVLLNETSADTPQIAYTFTVSKAQASNVGALYQLLGLVFPSAATAAPGGKAAPQPRFLTGCALVPIAYKTASIKVDTAYTSGGGSPFSASQSFTNEATQWWDVSFALPVTKASTLQYSSTANTVTSTQINKQSLYAVFDWYIPKADLSATGYSLMPHPFAGVGMTSQPLHSFIFGASIGLHLAEVYAGALLLKQQELSGLAAGGTGTAAQVTGATSYGYKASFSVGIKISIGTAVKSLANSK